MIRAKNAARELLSIRDPVFGLRLPRGQFAGGKVVPGMEQVLAAMHVQDDWMRLQLLFDEDVWGALESGHIDEAVQLVRAYLPTDEG